MTADQLVPEPEASVKADEVQLSVVVRRKIFSLGLGVAEVWMVAVALLSPTVCVTETSSIGSFSVS